MRAWVWALSTAGREKKFLAELVEIRAALATSSMVGPAGMVCVPPWFGAA
jgi:hypothetical protein